MLNLQSRIMSSRTNNSTLEKFNDVMEKTKIPIRPNDIISDGLQKTKIPICKIISWKEDIGAVRRSYASSSTAPEISPIINTETETRRETHRNILGGEWDREKWFDSNGGTLKKDGSSVELYVPCNAVSKAHISGKVFTDANIFYSIFKLGETERPVSPMVEFVEHNQVQFDRHLRVKIPTVVKSLSDPSFRVLSISVGDQVQSIPFSDTSDKEKPDVYYVVRGGNVFVYTKHFTSFICASCNTTFGTQCCFVFGSRIPYPTAGKCDVSLRLYICDVLYSIEDFRTSLCDTEKRWGRDCWDGKPINTQNWDLDDTISSSIELSTEPAELWKRVTRRDGTDLFKINPEKLRDVQRCLSLVVGEWKFTTTALDALFQCIIDIDRINGNIHHRCVTLDVHKDSTVNAQLTDTCINGLTGVSEMLMKTLSMDQARDLARNMDMNETDLRHILTNNPRDARECVRQIIIKLQGLHGRDFIEKLIPSLMGIGRRDVVEAVTTSVGAPSQGTRTRAARQTEEPSSQHTPSKKKK